MRNRKTYRRLFALLLAVLLLSGLYSAAAEEAADPAPAEPVSVEAATVDELLAAIAPDTCITLTSRSYDLTAASDYGTEAELYYSWGDAYDGYELVIRNVSNLTIRASRPGTEIVTAPRYAAVLRFENCHGITLEGLTAGHTDGAGYCTGAVIHLGDCSGVTIEGCELYGCGTFGVEAERSRDVLVHETVIRDCSYGAVSATGCSGMLFDGCTIFGIEGYGVFSMGNCRACALINSVVRSCSSESALFNLSFTRDFTLAGCEITGSNAGGMFSCAPYPIIVDGCLFRNNDCASGWYFEDWQPSERAVDSDGEPYTNEELQIMQRMKDATWTAPAERVPETAAPEVSEDGMVHVSNVDELLASIAPNTCIYLEDGTYDLSLAAGYGSYSTDYYYWMPCYDGPGLVIRGCEGLTITAGGPHRARILAEPRYCEVLSFEECRDLRLANFTAGHSGEILGGCAGGVLSLVDSHDVAIEDCSLFGCGVLGISALNCGGVDVYHTEIRNCSDGAFYICASSDVSVRECHIHDIGGYTWQVYDSGNVTCDGEPVADGASM